MFDIEKIKEIKDKEDLVKALNEIAAKSSNSFWWLKLIAFANTLIINFEVSKEEISGETKKKLTEEILYPIYDKIKPKKLSLADTLTLGLTKKFICNIIVEGIVFCYNTAFGHLWKEKLEK